MYKNQYRYYDLVMAAFVTVLITSNLIGPAKISQIEVPFFGMLTFGAGVLFFPISFIFGDILTEVYGYAASRRVIWAGFIALAFASFMAWMIVALPPAPFLEESRCLRNCFWLSLASFFSKLDCFCSRRICKLFRVSKNENYDQGQISMEPNHYFYHCRRSDRFCFILSISLL